MHPAIAEGIRLFNSQQFFEAHEALESVWLTEQGEEKLFLHGLIQVAAAFHHYQRNNLEGFRRVLAKGMAKLSRFSGERHGVNVDDFKAQMNSWASVGSHLRTPPPLPHVGTGPRM